MLGRHKISGQIGGVGGKGVELCALPPWSHHLACAHVFLHVTRQPFFTRADSREETASAAIFGDCEF